MNRLLRIVFFTCLWSANFAMAQTAQSEYVAIFKNVSGHVVIVRGDHEVLPVAGTLVMRTDAIRSGPASSGGLIFRDGTALTVGASTEVEIRRYLFEPEENKYAFDVFLKKGSAVYASGKLAKLAPEAVSLSTPRATTGVRGTRFIFKEE
jgi:hypothetical protein